MKKAITRFIRKCWNTYKLKRLQKSAAVWSTMGHYYVGECGEIHYNAFLSGWRCTDCEVIRMKKGTWTVGRNTK